MIKAFLFDYGGVISAGGTPDSLPTRLSTNLGISFDDALELIKTSWGQFTMGNITEAEFWARLEQHYGQAIKPGQRDIWNGWEQMQPLPEMVDLVERLKQQGYQVGLLSNVIEQTSKDIRHNGGYDSFDFTVLSYEVHQAKADDNIYQTALANLPGIKPEEIIFLDDQERCLVPARAIGIQTILVTTSAQAIAAVEELLVP